MMLPSYLQLALVVGIGIGAQWLAWRVGVPSILFLLLSGWTAGPLLGWIRPDALMGDLLMPVVSLSVGLILFEGGMSLQRKELAVMGSVTWRLVTFGAAVTFVMSTMAAYYLLDFEWPVAMVTGAILVVTGPTVIGPLLRHIRPTPQAGSVLKWEGIVIDPIGALLAVLVLEATIHAEAATPFAIAASLAGTAVVGTALGLGSALLLVLCLKRYWIPDYLQSPATLALVMLSFAVSNALQHEAGLLAATVMGIAVANQKQVAVKHVLEFKENLRVLLLSALFILLSARLEMEQLRSLDWRAFAFVGVLVLLVRPVSVLVSTLGSNMGWRERGLVAWVAPRGIVAAAITSVFAFELEQAGFEDAARMTPVMFLVITLTVLLYGLTAAPLARWLGVTQPPPKGLLLAGAHPFARQLARAVGETGFKTLLVDRNSVNVREAKLEGLNAQYGDIMDQALLDDSVAQGLGTLLALTPNDMVNSFAAQHCSEVMEQKDLYQLPLSRARAAVAEIPRHLQGRPLFDPDLTFEKIAQLMEDGYQIKTTPLTASFTFKDYQARYEGKAFPLLWVEGANLNVITAGDKPRIGANARVIGLAPPA